MLPELSRGLQAEYPQVFLDEIKGTAAEKYFKPGTFDYVMHDNIRLQGRIFHRIVDGVGSETELQELENKLSAKMPFLFQKRDEQQIVSGLLGDFVHESELVPPRDQSS